MIVFMDGGSQKHSHNGRLFLLSWGIVVHHNDETTELHGCKTHMPQNHSGSHERIAFMETVRHLMTLDVTPQEVSFYTDDSSVCDINEIIRRSKRLPQDHTTIQRFKKLADEYYDAETFAACMSYLMHSRFTKVKGHSRTVYNLRCDELSCHARRWALGDLSPLLPFEDWLHDGFLYYDREQQPQRWFPPFSDKYQEAA